MGSEAQRPVAQLVTMQGRTCHPLDSQLYGSVFGHREMADIFLEDRVQQARLDAELALLQAQDRLALVPPGVAARVAICAHIDGEFLARIGYHLDRTQNDIVALVRALQERCPQHDREFIHYGATSQDIHITGLALLLRQALPLLQQLLAQLQHTLVTLAETHRHTLMAGRTHGGLAVPITFGHKLALWLSQITHHRHRLEQLTSTLLQGHMKGAVGTHAAFGMPQGLELEQQVMATLQLHWSPFNLQPSEERYGEFLNWQALLSHTLGRICQDVRGLHRSEVREVQEYFEYGVQIGSSAMPHKQNPELSETLQGLTYKIRSNAACMLGVMQEHERDATRNANEHLLIGESTIITARLLEGVHQMLQTLEINRDRMVQNLALDHGLIASEPVTVALARKTGQPRAAHHIIYDCAMATYQQQRPFVEILREDERVSTHLSPEELEQALCLSNYLGSISFQIDQAIEQAQQQLHTLTASSQPLQDSGSSKP